MTPDLDYLAAVELATKAKDPEHHRLLVKATTRALEAAVAEGEVRQLLAFWRTMPEHITGATAIRQLADVLDGGRAPRSASAPKA